MIEQVSQAYLMGLQDEREFLRIYERENGTLMVDDMQGLAENARIASKGCGPDMRDYHRAAVDFWMHQLKKHS